jgi:hypothetical protein
MKSNLILNVARGFTVLGLVLATTVISACSTETPDTPNATAQAPDPLIDFTGIWKGTSTSDVNAAKVQITFDITRDGDRLKGTYRCAPLNAVCRDNLDRGQLSGTIRARGFTVAMQNTGWCTFMLDKLDPPVGEGGYTCYMNGMLADEGTFDLRGSSSVSDVASRVRPRT